MDNDDFRRLWFLLDRHVAERSDGVCPGLISLNAVGIISAAERLRDDLSEFCHEVVARSKAKIENAKADEDLLRDHVGSANYDAIPTEHRYGLDFGKPK